MSFLTVFNYVVTSMGQLLSKIPTAFELWFPQTVSHIKSVGIVTPKTVEKVGFIGNEDTYALDTDNADDSIYNYEQGFASNSVTCAVMVPDVIEIIDAPITSDISVICDGFVEETNTGTQTNKTSQAQSGTTNDLNLCPANDAANGKVYIGSNNPFWRIWFVIGTGGAGNWTNVGYYWDGDSWETCVDEEDQTASFTQSGTRRWQHTPQVGWAKSTIQGMNLYWVMINTDYYVNRTTKPLGTQVWVSVA